MMNTITGQPRFELAAPRPSARRNLGAELNLRPSPGPSIGVELELLVSPVPGFRVTDDRWTAPSRKRWTPKIVRGRVLQALRASTREHRGTSKFPGRL